MILIPVSSRAKLIANGRRQADAQARGRSLDLWPVLKLFAPDANATWLLSELHEADPDRAFALCDLGLGQPELGWVTISDVATVRGRLGLPVERDRHFRAAMSLAAYAEDARRRGRIQA